MATAELLKFGHVMIPTSLVFYRTKLSYAFVNKRPILPGHVLAASLRPAERFSSLTQDEDGQESGQSVKHVHVHVIPRKKGDFENNDDIYHELAVHDKDENRKERSLEEMEKEAIILRDKIQNI